MSSSNNQKPKTSRVAKILVKPVWRRKLDQTHVTTSQPIPTSHTHPNNSSQQNQPNIISFSSIPPQNSYPNNSTILSQQDEFTITLTNKLPNDPFGENAHSHQHLQQNTHPITSTPPSPSILSEQSKFDDELKEAHELNALLALHLTQQPSLLPPQTLSLEFHEETSSQKLGKTSNGRNPRSSGSELHDPPPS